MSDAYLKLFGDEVTGTKGLLDGVILGGEVPIKGKNVFGKPKTEFIKQVKDQIKEWFIKFDPTLNDNLSAYMNFMINKKKPGIIDKFKKEEFTKDIEERKGDKGGIPKDYGTDLTKTPEEILIAKEERAARKKLEAERTFRKEAIKKLGFSNELFENIISVVTRTWSGKLPKISSNKLKPALKKDFRRELMLPIKRLMGKGPKYIEFLEKFYKLRHHIPQKTWVRFEREVPRDERIFTEAEIESMSRKQTKRAIKEGRVPKGTNLDAGNTLWKYKDSTLEQFKEFFQAIHTESPSSSKGTRKTALAEEIGVEFAFDETMDVLRDPAVISKRAVVNELLKRETVENELEVIGKQIERNPSIQHSRDVEVKATQEVADRFYGNRSEFINRIQEQGFTPKGIGRAFDIAYPEGIKAKDGKTSLKPNIVREYNRLLKPFFAIDKRYKEKKTEFPQTIEEYIITTDLGKPNVMVKEYYKLDKNIVDYHRDPT